MFKLSDVLDRRHVVPGLEARDKGTLLSELGQRAGVALKLNRHDISAALIARERLGSTGVGQGIAIPHARVDGLHQPFGMFARIEPPVDFDAIDGRAVDLVFLMLTPPEAAASHLSALAAISRRLREPATAAALRAANDAGEMYRALT